MKPGTPKWKFASTAKRMKEAEKTNPIDPVQFGCLNDSGK